jgi:hypothetical protein
MAADSVMTVASGNIKHWHLAKRIERGQSCGRLTVRPLIQIPGLVRKPGQGQQSLARR